MSIEDGPTPAPAPRIVLLSIVAFWALYFVLWSLRATVVYHSGHQMFVGRALVSAASAGVTLIVYLVMRRMPMARLGRSMIIAALLSAPAALSYSAINWFVMDHLHDKQPMSWHWSPPQQPHTLGLDTIQQPQPSTVVIRENGKETVTIMPPAPPAPPPPVGVGTMPMGDEETPLMAIVDQAANGFFFFVAWASIYLALCYAAQMGALERRTATLRAAAQAAELRALRYQVNPHFLFNTLNSLSSLVMIGRKEAAERMIINLSTFFRTSLTGDPTEDVPLSEEIQLQRLYLDIEAVRFPERLKVAIDVPDALLAACIPGLILQPLVENAVKYGASRARRPVTVRIAARQEGDRLVLLVEDDGDPLDAVADPGHGGTGVGLRNVRDRLSARFGEEASCHWAPRLEGGFSVRLVMPLVRHGC
jgi:two-component system, LytTR family, sensor kinase